MPDPSWVASGGGSPEANGPYTDAGEHLSRRYFRLLPDGPYLWWSRSGHKYYISDALGATHPNSLYASGIYKYDLPANPWYIAGTGEAPPPTLAAWEPPEPPARPVASEVLTEGRVDPASLLDPSPTFYWSYTPGDGGAQAAYQVQVSTSAALRDAHTPDIWDSGEIPGDLTEITFPDNEELADLTIFFLAVRVKDAAGVWSEDW